MSPAEQDRHRDERLLHSVLKHYRGWRVEVLHHGQRRRLIVGQSTGWMPVTLGLLTSRSLGGSLILDDTDTTLVRVIEQVR